MQIRICSFALLSVFLMPIVVLGQGSQTGGGDLPPTTGNQTGGGNVPTTPTPVTGPQTTADFQSNPVFDIGQTLEQFNIMPEPMEIENLRVQPFVGRSRARYFEQGLIHPRSLIEPSEGSGAVGGGGRFGGGAGGGRLGGRGTAGGQQNGFEITRMGLRTRVIPKINPQNRPTGQQVSSRFQSRMARIPSIAALANSINVSINGKTAVLTGTVATQQQRDRIERITRLEPGIYRIDNRISVTN